LTGGTVISEEVGMKLDDVQHEHLGSCKKVTVTKNDTIILDGSGSKESISLRCELIRNSIDTTASEMRGRSFRSVWPSFQEVLQLSKLVVHLNSR